MTIREATFDSVKDVKRFVQQNEKQSEDIDVCRGNYMVGGKSMLGVLGLGIHKKLNVVIHGREVRGRSGYRASFLDGRSYFTVLLIYLTDSKERFYDEPFL